MGKKELDPDMVDLVLLRPYMQNLLADVIEEGLAKVRPGTRETFEDIENGIGCLVEVKFTRIDHINNFPFATSCAIARSNVVGSQWTLWPG